MQALELPHHEIRHVVSVALRANPSQVPDPGGRIRVEPEQPFLGQRREELDCEERIAAGPLLHQLRQRMGGIPVAVKRVGNKPADIVQSEGQHYGLLYCGSRLADRLQGSYERVRWTYFVLAIGSHQHQVAHIRNGNQVLQQFNGCGVQPLQIVEEQCKRVLLRGERAEEAPEDQLEAVLRISRRQVWNGRLFPDDELHLRERREAFFKGTRFPFRQNPAKGRLKRDVKFDAPDFPASLTYSPPRYRPKR